jgi:D-glycero-alpha-D-manno-heptose-7-phosphate kinase
VFFTGRRRDARAVLGDQNKDLSSASRKLELLDQMVAMVDPFIEGLTNGDFEVCGRLLKEGWEHKRQLSSLVCEDFIDLCYKRAMKKGAYGGKVLGAGGGGFLLFMAPPDAHAGIRSALSELRELDFGFDFSGTKIIHVGEQ